MKKYAQFNEQDGKLQTLWVVANLEEITDWR